MAKYYLQSGTLRVVVSAEDSMRAALWAVHRAMQQVVPIYDDELLTPAEKQQYSALEGLVVLGDDIRISELGFDRADAEELLTFQVVQEWHQLMVALSKLEQLLSERQNQPEVEE